MDPSSNGANQGGINGSAAGRSTTDELFNFSQAAASMFMNGTTNGGAVSSNTGEHVGGGGGGMDDMWGMSDSTNTFFNMDAFSSAPATAIGNGANNTATTSTSGGGGVSSGIDLSAAFGIDMSGASMDPDAWKMLLQGDPSMDDLFAGFGS
ncbi:hypothetical protein GGH95_002771, partial [Coemansia sp. RSA 1836]